MELRRTEDEEEDARGLRVAEAWLWDSLYSGAGSPMLDASSS